MWYPYQKGAWGGSYGENVILEEASTRHDVEFCCNVNAMLMDK